MLPDNAIISINRRNLITNKVDKARVQKMAPKIRKAFPNHILIACSGYDSMEDIKRDAPLVDGFLIGHALLQGKLKELNEEFPDKTFEVNNDKKNL